MINDLSEAKIFPRSKLEEMGGAFIADNNIHAVYGKDMEGLHIVHFLVDEEDEEDEETLELSESEKLDLNSFFIETIQSADFLNSEVQDNKEDSELYWVGSQIGDRMFDLSIEFNDYKLTCVVYECDPCLDDGSENWTTNIHKHFVLHKDLDAFQLADLSHVFRDRMTKWKISGKSRTWWIMLYKVDEQGDPIEVNQWGDPTLYVEEQVIEELREEGFSNPQSAYFKLVDDLRKEALAKSQQEISDV